MTQRLGARSGRLVRPRRGHQLSAGHGQQRLHPVHGIEHGGGSTCRLPLAHEGQGEGRDPDPCRSALHPHVGRVRCLRRHPLRERHCLPRRPGELRLNATTVGFTNTSWPTPMLRRSSRKVSGIPKIWQGCSAASTSRTTPMMPSRAIGATRSPGTASAEQDGSKHTPQAKSTKGRHGLHGHGIDGNADMPRRPRT